MARGFIRDDFEIQLLILYILGRVVRPIDLGMLTELTLCDDGINYFQFSASLNRLIETKHVVLNEDDRYAITDRGRQNGTTCESEIPYSVRMKCDRSVAELNKRLNRENQVRAVVNYQPDSDTYATVLTLDDDVGNVMTLQLMVPSEAQGEAFSKVFRANAERIYSSVLETLTLLEAESAAETE